MHIILYVYNEAGHEDFDYWHREEVISNHKAFEEELRDELLGVGHLHGNTMCQLQG